MTGRTPNRLGIRDWIPPQSGIFLRPGEITVAQLLEKSRLPHAPRRQVAPQQPHRRHRTHARRRGLRPLVLRAKQRRPLAHQPDQLHPQRHPRRPTHRPFFAPRRRRGRPLARHRALGFDSGHARRAVFPQPVVSRNPRARCRHAEFLDLYAADTDVDRRHYDGAASQMDAAVGQLLSISTPTASAKTRSSSSRATTAPRRSTATKRPTAATAPLAPSAA